jgi:NAD(P)-dependent dehydrogenase (short-subunit alcohol dehydrogenase family)
LKEYLVLFLGRKAVAVEESARKAVVVTGVSSGIGYATARELIDHGYQLFGSVRKQEDADRLAAEWGEAFTPLLFDVTDEAAIETAADQVEEYIGEGNLAGLVNNAGIAVAGPLMYVTIDEIRRQFEANVFGVTAVTQAFLPLLGAWKEAPRPRGRIINISSVSGHTAYPFMGPYAASKSAMEAMSNSLRRELLLYDIDVILIVPGTVKTPIWDKADQIDVEQYADTDYIDILKRMQQTVTEVGRQGMPVEKVSRTVRLALETPRPKVRYVLANSWLYGWMLPRWMPARWLDRIVARQWGLAR